MRILGHLDRYGPPVGGGIITTVTILRELARRGHDVCVLTNREATLPVHGTRLLSWPSECDIREAYDWADFIVPHMTSTPNAASRSRRSGKHLVYPVYDDGQCDLYGLHPEDVAMVIFCSTGLQQRSSWPGRQIVVYPPIFVDEHRVERTGTAITIPSLSPEKGGDLFWKLVDRLKNREFLGVVGGWGQQILPEEIPENVRVMEHQGMDLTAVVRETRLLMLPSQRLGEGERYWTENWGRAGIEAACSGVPVIANPAPGPLEALGEAGIFCDRTDIEVWIAAIERLDDPAKYQRQSDLVYRRARDLECIVRQQLDNLEHELQRIYWSGGAPRHVPLDQASNDLMSLP